MSQFFELSPHSQPSTAPGLTLNWSAGLDGIGMPDMSLGMPEALALAAAPHPVLDPVL